jgi:hypothetical protein
MGDNPVTNCKRCAVIIASKQPAQCWYCQGHLCVTCWDIHGHCGESAAVAINNAARLATPRRRAALLAALGTSAPGSLGPRHDVN